MTTAARAAPRPGPLSRLGAPGFRGHLKVHNTLYDKGMVLARENAVPYKGGPDGEPVQWELLGITEVLPIYEGLADGAEILWTERAPRKLRNLRQMVKPKGAFRQ
jgi:hypothetical protein